MVGLQIIPVGMMIINHTAKGCRQRSLDAVLMRCIVVRFRVGLGIYARRKHRASLANPLQPRCCADEANSQIPRVKRPTFG